MKNQKNCVFKGLTTALLALALTLPSLSCSSGIQAGGETSAGASEDETSETGVSVEEPVYTAAEGEWQDSYAIVAHCLGCVDGRTETNCREAFIQSYEAGQRVFETDFALTSDGHLVIRHDFLDMSYYNLEQEPGAEYVMDYDTYMASKIKYLYTPLDIEGIVELLAEHPDAYLITDSKDTDAETAALQFTLFAAAIRAVDESIFDRVIVQLYNDEMYDAVSGVFPAGGYIYTLYQIESPDYEAIGRFCAEHGVAVVTMSYERMSAETCELLHKYGLKVYLHTVNRISQMLNWRMYGADGFYSDIVTQTDWERVTGNG